MERDELIDIQEVARLFGKSVESIRKYKNYGILKVADREGNKDLFGRQDVLRRRDLIKHLQVDTGLTLSQIADQLVARSRTGDTAAAGQQAEIVTGEDKLRILVADDESIVREALVEALSEDYVVLEAEDGPDTIQKALGALPDLILLDLRMPVMDGYQVCQILKEHSLTSHVPIIMVTALAATPEKIRGMDHGADDYVTKPFSIDELKARIKMVLRRARHLATV